MESIRGQIERVAWLDAAKGFGLLLVVIGHSNSWNARNPMWHNVIYSFHMPLFFFLTGCTLSLNSPKASLRRALSVSAPYFLISTLMASVYIISSPNPSKLDIFLGVIYGTGHTISVVPLWFLTSTASGLLLISSLSAIATWTSRNGLFSCPLRVGALGVLLISFGLTLLTVAEISPSSNLSWGSPKKSGLPWNIDLAPIAAGYMLVGNAFMLTLSRRDKLPSTSVSAITAASLAFIQVAICIQTSVSFDLNFRRIGTFPLNILINFVGIAAVLAFALGLRRISSATKFLGALGQSGLVVLWLHAGLENRVSENILSPFMNNTSPFFWFFSFLIATLAPAIIDRFIIRKTAFLKMIFYPKFIKFM